MLSTYSLFIQGYIQCALWTGVYDEKSDEIDSLTFDDIAQATVIKLVNDCTLFQQQAKLLLVGLDQSQCGHDFWLTRNGHGAGFWDRNLGDIGDQLTAVSKEFGEDSLSFWDSDGQVHSDNEHITQPFIGIFPTVLAGNTPAAHFNW